MTIPKPSQNLTALPPYVFVHVDEVKAQARAKGLDLIDMAMGNPDQPTPKHIVEELCRAASSETWTHRYPSTKGTDRLRKAIAGWYKARFNVDLNPDTEVLPLIGSKEGLAHLYYAFATKKDYIVATNPSYPVHYFTVSLAGAKLKMLPLGERNKFVPDLSKIPPRIADKTKILILNYPNNPTGATLDNTKLFEDAIAFAKNREMIVLHDFAYSEIAFDGYQPPSFMQVPGAKECGVEYHSLSKSFNMAGWRIGFVVGNAEVIKHLAKFKSFHDYGVPGFIQEAAAAALSGPQDCVKEICATYQRRRDAIVESFTAAGWKVPTPRASMYVWTKLPKACRKMTSLEFVDKLILEEGVAVSPGTGFGPHGEGYVRIAMVTSEDRIREAATRIKRFIAKHSAPVAA